MTHGAGQGNSWNKTEIEIVKLMFVCKDILKYKNKLTWDDEQYHNPVGDKKTTLFRR